MKKRNVFLILILLLLAIVAGCGETYDKEAFEEVRKYSDAIIPAIDETSYNYDVWRNEPTDENLQLLKKSIEKINQVNKELWTETLENEKEIEKWSIKMTQGQQSWVIEGKELFPALFDTMDHSDFLAVIVLEEIDKNKNNIDTKKIKYAIDDANESASKLRKILYNK